MPHDYTVHTTSIQLCIIEQEYLYINSALRTRPKDCTSTRRKNNQLSTIYHSIKATYTGIGFNRKSTNINSTSTHRYTFVPTILQITKIYRCQNIYLQNTPTSLPANTFYGKLHSYNPLQKNRRVLQSSQPK